MVIEDPEAYIVNSDAGAKTERLTKIILPKPLPTRRGTGRAIVEGVLSDERNRKSYSKNAKWFMKSTAG